MLFSRPMLPYLTLPSSLQCYLNVTLSSNVPSTSVYRQLRYTYEAIVTQRDQLLPSYRCYESNSGNRQSFQFSSQPVCSSKHSPSVGQRTLRFTPSVARCVRAVSRK